MALIAFAPIPSAGPTTGILDIIGAAIPAIGAIFFTPPTIPPTTFFIPPQAFLAKFFIPFQILPMLYMHVKIYFYSFIRSILL